MPTKRLTLILALAFATAAHGDLTLTTSVTGTGLGKMAEGENVTSIKGMRMLTEQRTKMTPMSTIFDLEKHQVIVLNPKKSRAQVHDVSDLAAAQKAISGSDMSVKITPTGETKKILDWSCEKHLIQVKVASQAMPGETVHVVVDGVAWLAADAPGKEEYAAFYAAAAEQGLFFGDPASAKAQPGREKAMTEMYRTLATAGLPLLTEITVGLEGSGLMAQMMQKMKVTISNTATSLSTDEIEPSHFEIPKGYKTKTVDGF